MDSINQALEKALDKMHTQLCKKIQRLERDLAQEHENLKQIKFEIARIQEEELQRKTPS